MGAWQQFKLSQYVQRGGLDRRQPVTSIHQASSVWTSWSVWAATGAHRIRLVVKKNLKMDSRIGLRATTADKDGQQAGLEATPRENRSQHFAPRGTSLSQRASCVWAWAPLRALRQAPQESKPSVTGLQDIRTTLRTSCRSQPIYSPFINTTRQLRIAKTVRETSSMKEKSQE